MAVPSVSVIYPSKTVFTGEPLSVELAATADCYLTITGPGPVAIEQLELDGAWRSFPETEFSGPTAQIVTLKGGQFRVVVDATEPTTVEVRV